MCNHYSPSGASVNHSEAGVPTTTPYSNGHREYTPPLTYDDPDLLVFAETDGPRLEPYTRAVYKAMARFVDPETGWAHASHKEIADIAEIKRTAAKKHIAFLDELGKFDVVARSSPEKGTEANAYFLRAWPTGLVPEPMTPPCDDPLGEARRIMAERREANLRAQHQWELEVKSQRIAELEAQLESLGEAPVPASEPDPPPPSRAATPPPPHEEPPPPDYSDVDQWFEEHWERLEQGGAQSFIRLREFYRKNPRRIEDQEERWRAADQAEEKMLSSRNSRQEPNDHRTPVWEGPPPDPEAEELWLGVLDNLQTLLPRPTFETWLKPTIGMAIEAGDVDALVVVAPTPFAVEWLERRIFHGLITELQKVADRPMELHLRVRGPTAEDESNEGGDSDSSPGGEHNA